MREPWGVEGTGRRGRRRFPRNAGREGTHQVNVTRVGRAKVRALGTAGQPAGFGVGEDSASSWMEGGGPIEAPRRTPPPLHGTCDRGGAFFKRVPGPAGFARGGGPSILLPRSSGKKTSLRET